MSLSPTKSYKSNPAKKRKEAELEVEDEVQLAFWGDTEALEKFKQRIIDRVNVSEIEFEEKDLEFSEEVEFRERKAGFSFSKPVAQ